MLKKLKNKEIYLKKLDQFWLKKVLNAVIKDNHLTGVHWVDPTVCNQ